MIDTLARFDSWVKRVVEESWKGLYRRLESSQLTNAQEFDINSDRKQSRSFASLELQVELYQRV